MNKLKSFLVSLIVIASGIVFSNAYDSGYNITNMDVKVEVNDKREYKITETIDVYFNEYRHGIIRSIPMSSSLEKYKIKDVVVEGSNYDVVKGSDFKIKIGDEDETIIGEKQYVVEYTLSHYKDTEKDGDYLYLNVLGTQWDTYIDNFTSTIVYPDKFEVKNSKVTSGTYGSTENNLVSYESKNNYMYIKSKGTISPENGITVNIKFNEGAFSDAPVNIEDILVKVFNTLSALLLIITISILFVSKSKKKNIQSTVEFYPPENLNSVELGYLYTNCVYDNTILSLIYCWANKGYLKIKLLRNSNFSLTKLRDIDEKEDEYEKELFNRIFSYGKGKPKVVTGNDLKYKLQADVQKCKRKVKDKFKNDENYLKENKIYKSITSITWFLILTSMFLDYNGDFPTFILLKLITISVLFGYFNGISHSNSDESKSIFANLLGSNNLAGSVTLFVGLSIMLTITSVVMSSMTTYNMFFENTAFIIVCSIWSLIIGKLIVLEKSDYEKEIYSRIIGFKEFIEIAEKDKLEMLIEEDSEYFYKILPYAQVLNVTDKWINKFELITIPQSNYYDYGYIGSPIGGAGALNNTFNRLGENIIIRDPALSSSSSSGGGFSGGGFSGGGSGGGGGSSW